MQTVFAAAGGIEGLRNLASAWHRRVMADDVVSHAFSHGFHPRHVERLATYWAEALGGPSTYSASYGDETSVVKIHSGSGEHDEMNRRAIACFERSSGRRRTSRQQGTATSAIRLLCLGGHNNDVPISPVC